MRKTLLTHETPTSRDWQDRARTPTPPAPSLSSACADPHPLSARATPCQGNGGCCFCCRWNWGVWRSFFGLSMKTKVLWGFESGDGIVGGRIAVLPPPSSPCCPLEVEIGASPHECCIRDARALRVSSHGAGEQRPVRATVGVVVVHCSALAVVLTAEGGASCVLGASDVQGLICVVSWVTGTNGVQPGTFFGASLEGAGGWGAVGQGRCSLSGNGARGSSVGAAPSAVVFARRCVLPRAAGSTSSSATPTRQGTRW